MYSGEGPPQRKTHVSEATTNVDITNATARHALGRRRLDGLAISSVLVRLIIWPLLVSVPAPLAAMSVANLRVAMNQKGAARVGALLCSTGRRRSAGNAFAGGPVPGHGCISNRNGAGNSAACGAVGRRCRLAAVTATPILALPL